MVLIGSAEIFIVQSEGYYMQIHLYDLMTIPDWQS